MAADAACLVYFLFFKKEKSLRYSEFVKDGCFKRLVDVANGDGREVDERIGMIG